MSGHAGADRELDFKGASHSYCPFHVSKFRNILFAIGNVAFWWGRQNPMDPSLLMSMPSMWPMHNIFGVDYSLLLSFEI